MELWRIRSKAAKGHAFTVAEDINHMALDSSKQRAGNAKYIPDTQMLIFVIVLQSGTLHSVANWNA